MTTRSDPRPSLSGIPAPAPTVYYDEPPIKPPPNLVVGPLAWMRDNLFSSASNTLATVIAAQGNWYIIVFNVRQFMVGRYEPDAEWRVALTTLISVFILGFALAAWARVPRRIAILIVVVLAVLFIIPLVTAALPLPPTYLSASADDITSGSSSEEPVDQFAFIARGGETLRLELAADLSTGDESLQSLHSFADGGANLLRAAADNRLTNQARIAEIERLLAEDLPNARTLTANQRAALETEVGPPGSAGSDHGELWAQPDAPALPRAAGHDAGAGGRGRAGPGRDAGRDRAAGRRLVCAGETGRRHGAASCLWHLSASGAQLHPQRRGR
ncbi:MAG: hypothetical protein IPK19_21530 [Chloroflexi bacterium]|nr:hypothetical protein [Chloroflexota bacterium]